MHKAGDSGFAVWRLGFAIFEAVECWKKATDSLK